MACCWVCHITTAHVKCQVVDACRCLVIAPFVWLSIPLGKFSGLAQSLIKVNQSMDYNEYAGGKTHNKYDVHRIRTWPTLKIISRCFVMSWAWSTAQEWGLQCTLTHEDSCLFQFLLVVKRCHQEVFLGPHVHLIPPSGKWLKLFEKLQGKSREVSLILVMCL